MLNQKHALSPWATSLVCRNSCSLSNVASHCEQEYKICYEITFMHLDKGTRYCTVNASLQEISVFDFMHNYPL